MKDKKLLDEIVNEAEKLPLECQEKVLDVVKAMAFTHDVMEKQNKEKNTEEDL